MHDIVPPAADVSQPPRLFDAVDLFAGPGGWDEGARNIGLTTVGLEWDHLACRTAASAGHRRIECDVTKYPTQPFAGIPGLIASPPCPDFSTAGQGRGEAGVSGQHVREPLRWVRDLRPEWTAWEQVAPVLPIWEECADDLRALGYDTWTGILNAANYGVPQERKRAVLIASRTRRVGPPPPTHAENADDLFGNLATWVTLADSLKLGRGWIYDSGQNSVLSGGQVVRYRRSCDRPAGTLTTKTTSQWTLTHGDQRRKLSIGDAARLQTFPPDYPWTGKREDIQVQIGNAVPPLLAAHILSAAAGTGMAEVAA